MDDLLPGFAQMTVEGVSERLLCRIAGPEGAPPVVLLHGYPQTHLMWHRTAPALAEDFRVILFDLPGYGGSSIPPDAPDHAPYSKRTMAREIAAAAARLGHSRFRLVGHDRGARVAYRMALDSPERVERLALLDIVPTGALWHDFSAERGLKFWHWTMLAQPAPLPERLIGPDPVGFIDRTIARWTKAGDLTAFDPRALDAYHRAFAADGRVHATCEDYRAGAGPDRAHDDASHEIGSRITAPTLVLWGDTGFAGQGKTPLELFAEFCDDVSGFPVASGHFLPEENPAETLARLKPFLAA